MTDTQPEAPAEPTLADEIVAELSRLRAARDRHERARRALRVEAVRLFENAEISPTEISAIASLDFTPGSGAVD